MNPLVLNSEEAQVLLTLSAQRANAVGAAQSFIRKDTSLSVPGGS